MSYTIGKCFELPLDLLKINEGEAGIGCGKSLVEEHQWVDKLVHERILEVGFGQGEFVDYLCGKNLVGGLDIGQASLKVVQEKYHVTVADNWDNLCDKWEPGKKIADLYTLDAAWDSFPWNDDTFTVASCTESIEHMDNPLHCVMEVKRVLKHEGLFIVSIPDHGHKFGWKGGDHAYIYPGLCMEQMFRWFLTQCYFKIEKFWNHGGTYCYQLRNKKKGPVFCTPFDVVKGNYYAHEVYGWLGNEEYLDMWTELKANERQHKADNPGHGFTKDVQKLISDWANHDS